jgi:hypothetical protein
MRRLQREKLLSELDRMIDSGELGLEHYCACVWIRERLKGNQ